MILRHAMFGLLAVLAAVAMPLSASPANANVQACAAQCSAQYNQCRMAKKGAPACDQIFTACNQRCIAQPANPGSGPQGQKKR